jgi:dihydroorotase
MLDLVVEGNAYLDGEINKCCIGIEKGKIVAIKKILKGDIQLDFGDKLILPAGIDSHVHFRDPGFSKKEDFTTGTIAAAFGGIGCVFDMPNTIPPIVSKETLIEKFDIVSKKAYIDFGLYSSIASDTDIPTTAEACSAFKIYLGETTGKLRFPKNVSLDSVINQINKYNRIPTIHAEDENILQHKKTKTRSIKTLHDYLLSRPNAAEVEAVENILRVVNSWTNLENKLNDLGSKNQNSTIDSNFSTRHHVHICHVSTAEVAGLLRKRNALQKQHTNFMQQNNSPNLVEQLEPLTLTAEVTPHHLFLNEHSDLGAYGKVNPPLRTAEDQAALWSALTEGAIHTLASDHAPHTVDEKCQEFDFVPAGIPGVETMLPLMLSYHKHHKITLERLVEAISEIPAKIFELPKGKLATGYDGDLIVVDFFNEQDIKIKNLHSKCAWSPYEKMAGIFPLLTVVRGKIIMKDDNLESDRGYGKFYN